MGAPRIGHYPDPENLIAQLNRAFERLNSKFPKTLGLSSTEALALQRQIDQINNLNGSDINGTGTGVGGPSNTQAGTGTVTTDGLTISGDGLNTSIALIKPVTLRAIQTSTTPYAVPTTIDFVAGSAGAGADQVVNLPAATGTGRWIVVKKMDANAHNIVITRAGADTIDGTTTATITIQYDMVRLLDLAAAVWAIW